jgi:mannose/fructose/N-acetylgalactosamine-specific phosphotransferase system component IIC
MLQVNPESKSKLFEAANVLGGLLNAVGFAATLNVIDNASIPNKDTIHVLVGKKRT